jgi:hypothetical protein
MFADLTLTPKEAQRLCALGLIAERQYGYAELAGAVRHFLGRLMGPSLDLMGTSIELLRYEGLVEAVSGQGDDALLVITEAGRRELEKLLVARLRPGSDLSKLITALKMRFLHLLAAESRRDQVETMIDACASELARLADLRGREVENPASRSLVAWLDLEIDQLNARVAWLESFLATI